MVFALARYAQSLQPAANNTNNADNTDNTDNTDNANIHRPPARAGVAAISEILDFAEHPSQGRGRAKQQAEKLVQIGRKSG